MGLLDLKTDLKSLKYGDDRLGGGSSNQPYIQTDINTGQLSTSTSRGLGLLRPVETVANGIINTIGSLSTFVGNVDDGFIRGGAAGAAQASTTDLLRIGKFFTDAPRGPLFIARQVGLQLSNPRLEVKKGIRGVVSNILNLDPQGSVATLTGGLLQPTRIYNLGINTLAQVPVNAFGGHFNRHGLLPIQDEDSKYLSVVTSNNKGNQEATPNNRLAGLKNQFSLGDQKPNTNNNLVKKVANLPFKIIGNILKLKPLDILKGEDIIDSYLGGPKSVYGIGTTTIRRYDYTENSTLIEGAFNKAKSKAREAKVDFNTLPTGPYAIGGPSLSDVEVKVPALVENNNTIPGLNGISPAAKNYSKLKSAVLAVQQINQQIPFSAVPAANYNAKDYGPFKEKTFTTKPNNGLDRTAEDFKYYGNRGTTKDGSQAAYSNTDLFVRKDADIMTVAFRVIDPFSAIKPAGSDDKKRRHLFSAYLKGYKDDFTGNWNEINYAGRAESFYVYDKFKRNVSFNLQIPCNNRKELFEKHRNLGQMAATTAGAYSDKNTLGGVLIQINLGNYLVGEYGILNNLSYSIPDESSWDVTPEGRLAMYLEASFNFTIVHKELPQYQVDGGFFKYLPNNLKGFLPSITNPNDFIYDKYETDKFQDVITPDAVIKLRQPNPEFVRPEIIDATLPGPFSFKRLNINLDTRTALEQRARNPFGNLPPDPTLSRSQQAKADLANLSDPLGIKAAQAKQQQDPLGLNKYFSSVPQPPPTPPRITDTRNTSVGNFGTRLGGK